MNEAGRGGISIHSHLERGLHSFVLRPPEKSWIETKDVSKSSFSPRVEELPVCVMVDHSERSSFSHPWSSRGCFTHIQRQR